MRTSEIEYPLPRRLIAQRPLPCRRDARLLCLRPGREDFSQDCHIRELPQLLRAGDLLVFNDTKVLRARLRGRKASGGQVQLLLTRLEEPASAWALHSPGRPEPGAMIDLGDEVQAEVLEQRGDRFRCRFHGIDSLASLLRDHGEMPLPPYIKRPPEADDDHLYQTVFARVPGAVAAPTAGRHFDAELLGALDEAGIERAFLTLQVGAGSFKPIKTEEVENHVMEAENIVVTADLCERLRRTRERGGRVIAVGTTVARALETAAVGGELQPFSGETSIFISPGWRFRALDALITNFHMPRSTLLALVLAFAGPEAIRRAYDHAIAAEYRFLSYGDAMFIECPAPGNPP